jgi:hypothetical protein
VTAPHTPTVAELRARVTADNARYIAIEAGARPVRCQRCDADRLYWGTTKTHALTLVDCGVVGAVEPSADHDGRGVSHFATCPAAKSFRGRNR